MKCDNCGREVFGTVQVSGGYSSDEDLYVVDVEENERDWICCDVCNKVICFRCSKAPNTGKCDSCIEKASSRH